MRGSGGHQCCITAVLYGMSRYCCHCFCSVFLEAMGARDWTGVYITFFSALLIHCGMFGSPYLRKATAAAAALLIPTSVCYYH